MSQIEQLDVMVDSAGTIVVNEKTGTIVMGGNVRVGPAVIAHGSLNVRIDEEVIISQPAPLSQGKTVVTGQSTDRRERGQRRRSPRLPRRQRFRISPASSRFSN